jgi:hypothetical protein
LESVSFDLLNPLLVSTLVEAQNESLKADVQVTSMSFKQYQLWILIILVLTILAAVCAIYNMDLNKE